MIEGLDLLYQKEEAEQVGIAGNSRENAPLGTVKGRLRLGLRKLSGVLGPADDSSGSMLQERM